LINTVAQKAPMATKVVPSIVRMVFMMFPFNVSRLLYFAFA
jgi:hypothetical protein